MVYEGDTAGWSPAEFGRPASLSTFSPARASSESVNRASPRGTLDGMLGLSINSMSSGAYSLVPLSAGLRDHGAMRGKRAAQQGDAAGMATPWRRLHLACPPLLLTCLPAEDDISSLGEHLHHAASLAAPRPPHSPGRPLTRKTSAPALGEGEKKCRGGNAAAALLFSI